MHRTAALSALIAVPLALAGCGGADRDESGAITAAGEVGVQDVRIGDCANEAIGEVASVGAVPCTEPHDYEVFHLFDLPGTELPSSDQIDKAAVEACTPVFKSYVGIPFKTSKLDFYTALSPSPDSWAQGDREVVCGALEPKASGDGTVKLTSSVKDSRR